MKKIIFLIATFIFSNIAISQITYTFSGNGNWSDSANWLNRMVPPSPIPNGAVININPDNNGECIINIPVSIPPNVNLNLQSGKKMKVLGDMMVYYDSTVVLKDNVHVVDTTILVSNSTPSMIGQGIYQYTFSAAQPTFNNGDILVGPLNNGYIRKITSSATAGNTITFETTQANMEDVFKQGFFNFSLGTDSLLQRPASPTSNSYSYTFNDVTLYQNGPLTIKLNNGNITLNPNWNFNFDFQNLKIQNFEIACQDANLISNFNVNVTATQAVTLIDQVDTLKHLSRTYTKWIPVYGIPVPVVIEMNLDFICKYSASIDASINRSIAFNSYNNFSFGISYINNSWMPTYGFNSTNGITTNASTGNVNAIINLAIVPTFSFKLYGLVGPYASLGLQEQLKASVASPSLDWDFSASVWVRSTLGVNANALGYSLFDYSKFWDTDTLFYKTPYSIIKISGDNQTGQANQFLTQPIKIRVLDKFNNPQSNVPVYFTVTAGGGTVQDVIKFSDVDGYAQTLWQLGSQFGIQYLEAKAEKADGTLIQNAPLEFAATISSDSTFTDSRDGQQYTFRHIGSQVWMTKNLNYAAGGSWCNDDSSGNCAIYGRLYDWNTALTVAPPGWHLPTDAEWTTLTTFLGGDSVAGGAMKETGTAHWLSPNIGATNSSGFAGMPGGFRDSGGNGGNIGINATWWSSTAIDANFAWWRILYSYYAYVLRDISDKTYGFSVRCVRD